LLLGLVALFACKQAPPPPPAPNPDAQACRNKKDIAACERACQSGTVDDGGCSGATLHLSNELLGKKAIASADVTRLLASGDKACLAKHHRACYRAATVIARHLEQRTPKPQVAKVSASKPSKLVWPTAAQIGETKRLLAKRTAMMKLACAAGIKHSCGRLRWFGLDDGSATGKAGATKNEHQRLPPPDAAGKHIVLASQRARRNCNGGQAQGCFTAAAILYAVDPARAIEAITTTYRKLALADPISLSLFAQTAMAHGMAWRPKPTGKRDKRWPAIDPRQALRPANDAQQRLRLDYVRSDGKKLDEQARALVKNNAKLLDGCMGALIASAPQTAKAAERWTMAFWVDGHGRPLNFESNWSAAAPFAKCVFAGLAKRRLAAAGPARVILRFQIDHASGG